MKTPGECAEAGLCKTRKKSTKKNFHGANISALPDKFIQIKKYYESESFHLDAVKLRTQIMYLVTERQTDI